MLALTERPAKSLGCDTLAQWKTLAWGIITFTNGLCPKGPGQSYPKYLDMKTYLVYPPGCRRPLYRGGVQGMYSLASNHLPGLGGARIVGLY